MWTDTATVSSAAALAATAPRAERREPDGPAAAQVRQAQARYAALAGQPDALARALTGKPLSQLPPRQQALLRALAQDLQAGRMAWPAWRQAHPAAGAPAAGGADALFHGALAAFVPGQGGAPGTALLARGLDPAVRDAAIAEELGEAIAHAAAQRGIEVGAGDRGARLAAALGGRREFRAEDFKPRPEDGTAVRLDGRVQAALAKAAAAAHAKQPLRVEFPGGKGFELRFVWGKGKTYVARDQGKGDGQKGRPGYIELPVNQGYTGRIDILAPGGKPVLGQLTVTDYGGPKHDIALKGSGTHQLRRLGGAIRVERKPVASSKGPAVPAKHAPKPLRLAFPGHAGFELHFPLPQGKRYIARDNAKGDASGTPGLLQMPVNLGYSGDVKVMAGLRQAATLVLRHYGRANQVVDLKPLTGYEKGFGADGSLKLTTAKAKPPARPASRTSVDVAVHDGGYVLVTTPKERFVVVSGMTAANRAKYQGLIQEFTRNGWPVRDDLNRYAGEVRFEVPYGQAGEIQVRYPSDPDLPEADLAFANAGTEDFKVTRTERLTGRGPGRSNKQVNSLVSAGTIIVGGQTDNQVVAGRLADNLMASRLIAFTADLNRVEITKGGTSAEQMTALETGLFKATTIIAEAADALQGVIADFAEVAQRGMTFRELAPQLEAGTGANLTEEQAIEIVKNKISGYADRIKNWLRDNAASIRGAVENYRNTRSAEAQSRMENLLAIIDVVAGLASGIGTFGSAAASVASLMVRTKTKADRLPKLRKTEAALETRKAELEGLPNGSPQREQAQKAVDEAEQDRKDAFSAYQSQADLVNIGRAQMASWTIAVPGAGFTAGSRSQKLKNLLAGDAGGLRSFADELKQFNSKLANANRGLVKGMKGTEGAVKSVVDSLNIAGSEQWKEFGRALFFGLSAVAQAQGIGTYHASVSVEDEGNVWSRSGMAKRYEATFDRWLAAQPAGGQVYYLKGKAKYDEDIGYYDGKIDIFKVDFPAMAWFPR